MNMCMYIELLLKTSKKIQIIIFFYFRHQVRLWLVLVKLNIAILQRFARLIDTTHQ